MHPYLFSIFGMSTLGGCSLDGEARWVDGHTLCGVVCFVDANKTVRLIGMKGFIFETINAFINAYCDAHALSIIKIPTSSNMLFRRLMMMNWASFVRSLM